MSTLKNIQGMHKDLTTEILPVNGSSIDLRPYDESSQSLINEWSLRIKEGSIDAQNLQRAADELRTSDVPVAFPTETVYGLGADATRSEAVQGIYRAKQRPSDNPLIVHIHSLEQLRLLLRPAQYRAKHSKDGSHQNGHSSSPSGLLVNDDPIPEIYLPLISKFWPGPLTLLMPNPPNSILAPEVTAGLPTFGARMPNNKHALALLRLTDVPLAAPSANASTKPSPTEAAHVKHDLDGRISTIIDGGPCQVGVESTVVDGLCDPPAILRPGGVSLEELRECKGWENVTVGYEDAAEQKEKPRAPGMKYRHYSPKAPVVLFEYGRRMPSEEEIVSYLGKTRTIGIIRTTSWPMALGLGSAAKIHEEQKIESPSVNGSQATSSVTATKLEATTSLAGAFEMWDIDLGNQSGGIATGLFSALRKLDQQDVDAILVEGIDDSKGDISMAVMNRLRKAAEVKLR